MRLLYGLSGCGLGHVMRAQVIGEHLRSAGHEVLFVSSGRPVELLRERGFDCLALKGMSFRYVGGAVARWRSARDWLGGAPAAAQEGARLFAGVRRFDPQRVLTDYELFSRVAGQVLGVPVVSVDHQHVVDRCEHPRAVRRHVGAFGLLRAACALKTAACARYVVSSFYFPRSRCERTTVVGPILRPIVERAQPSRGEHVIVYQTTPNDPTLIPTLRASPGMFIVYGRDEDAQHGNVTLRRFDEGRFVAELASARAVITNGGFTAMGEALALSKPVLSVPVPHQPEQALNAAWLSTLGWGTSAARLTPRTVREFLRRDYGRPSDPRLRSGRADACAAIDAALEAP
jgi:uncharacterized protein (TIGR00661 family)